ncbi:S-layer homology domain-containing protein [Candidatus Dojkabacteria bacterium]|uniref:S-layer homology domain-containing protein n=1 Tax=Candidatus Dojkabacteria bacterium TaxID=2099670 RepID=A0A955L970_9BACT|nr:S-layer homology domain-containing protein [Candidatus Dojkabacteria bacterium]
MALLPYIAKFVSGSPYYAGEIVNVCGDPYPYPQDPWPAWDFHDANPACTGCWDAACSGTVDIYTCHSGEETYENGGMTCTKNKVTKYGQVLHINEFQDPCVVKRVEVRSGTGYSDFVFFKGDQFGTAACSSSSSGGVSSVGTIEVGPGTMVNVCGDSTPSNGSANWGEHNANSLCTGCVNGSNCSGYSVEVYKCYTSSQLGPNSGAYECRMNRVNSISSYEEFNQWFTDPNSVVQIDVKNASGTLVDFVIWKGNNFGVTSSPVSPGPVSGPTCQRICTDINNCPFYNPTTQQTFPDVPASNPYFPHIQNLECENVIHGYSDGTFKPYQPITRGEMAKIIENGYRFPENTNCGGFTDVPTSNKFYVEIMTLKCNGVISGYSDNSFRTDTLVTRAEAMKFIINGARVALGNPNFVPQTIYNQVYTDVPSYHPFSMYIMSSYSNGITDPNYPSNQYRPDNLMVRQEMALYVDKMMEKLYQAGWGI